MSSLRTSAIGALLSLAVLVAGDPSFNLGDGYAHKLSHADDACRDAFNADVACGPELGDFMRAHSVHRKDLTEDDVKRIFFMHGKDVTEDDFKRINSMYRKDVTEDDLDAFCTDSCLKSLRQHWRSVRDSCEGAAYQLYTWANAMPTSRASEALLAYRRICLKNDDGQYCGIWDQGLPRVMTDLRCDGCWSKMLHVEALSPFNLSPAEQFRRDAFQSAYCHHDPRSHWPKECTRGKEDCACKRLIKPDKDDTWHSLSLKYSVPTSDLSTNNGIDDLTPENVHLWRLLCISSPCRIRTIEVGDTCDSIASAAGVETSDLVKWNPWVEFMCDSLSGRAGEMLCVSRRFHEEVSRPFEGWDSSSQEKPAHGDSPFDVESDQDVLMPDDL
ncbi:hypothetical protein ACHAPT_012366 [Fusarium lateritium]